MKATFENRPVRGPLFAKLGMVFVLTSALVVFAVASYLSYFFAPRSEVANTFFKNAERYVLTLVEEIGEPPNLTKAADLAKHLDLEIRIEGPGVNWTTSPALGTVEELKKYSRISESGASAGRFHRRFFILVQRNQTYFAFSFRHEAIFKGPKRQIFGLLALVGVIFLISYGSIRWMFYPLRRLMQGVTAIAEGNLDYQVPSDKPDELGKIGRTFNLMTGRIKEMIRAKHQLLLDVSHELRSPLTRMKLSLEFIDDHALRESINSDIREMETMLNEILETDRLGSPYGGLSVSDCDLYFLIESVVTKYSDSLPGLRFLGPKEIVSLRVDPVRVQLVLKNLIENALKYSQSQNRPVEISLVRSLEGASVQVRDWGHGIPKAEQPFVFEPFYRVDKSRTKETGGYGLGLSLCKKIMQAHGGDISITSQEDEGTTVTIFFPRRTRTES